MTDEIGETLREIVARLEALAIPYMLVGSVAALAHGRERSTKDFDVVVDADAAKLRALVHGLPTDRFYASEAAAMEALRHHTQFNLIDLHTGWKVDLIVRKPRPFSTMEFSRRCALDVLGVKLFVATIEDTIIAKLEWAKAGGGSQRQLEDARALIRLAGAGLDRPYVEHWIAELGLAELWTAARA